MSAAQNLPVNWTNVPTRTITAGGVEFAYRELRTNNPGTPVVFLIHLAAVLDNWALSPSSRSLPRTTVHRVSLANTRRHASTWSSRSTTRARRASRPTTFTSTLTFHEYTSWPSRVMCHPHENTRRACGRA